mgnify:CR=1 FL=1
MVGGGGGGGGGGGEGRTKAQKGCDRVVGFGVGEVVDEALEIRDVEEVVVLGCDGEGEGESVGGGGG